MLVSVSVGGIWSGRRDLNPGPLAPQASALARLRHGPNGKQCSRRVWATFLIPGNGSETPLCYQGVTKSLQIFLKTLQ